VRRTSTTALIGSFAVLASGLATVPYVTANAATGSAMVTTVADSGPGSLRDAIMQANTAGGPFTIQFGVTGRIALTSALPDITSDVVIDGTTAPTYVSGGPPLVQIDANGHGGLVFGTAATGSMSALSVTGASGDGVQILGSGVVLASNYIGLTPAGVAAGNGGDGVELARGSGANMIGGNSAEVSGAVSNVISGNEGSGIRMVRSSQNTVQANYIGTDPAGATAVPNGIDGITLADKSTRNTIGGRAFTDSATGQSNNPTGSEGSTTPVFVVPPLGNLVSGNERQGVTISDSSSRNVLNGNFIGTTAGGDDGLGNRGNGVLIEDSDDNKLQGCRFQDDPFVYYNILSDNGKNGLRISNSDGTVVQANFFGVAADNTTLLGNGGNGLVVDGDSTDTQVGGVIPLGNVIAGNTENGIVVKGKAGGFTTFNTFGGLLAFKGAAPNGENGILVTATGGDILLRTNVFSGNDGNGIEIGGRATDVTVDPNIVGLNTRGDGVLSNGANGILVTDKAHHNTIGGDLRSVIRQNTLSGNDRYGLVIKGEAHHNKVFDTFIGSNIQGIHKGSSWPLVGNELGGVLVSGKARNNVLGYSGKGQVSKLISGNDGPGVTLKSKTKNNKVVHNYIGRDRRGDCLQNERANVIDKGRGNKVKGNSTCRALR